MVHMCEAAREELDRPASDISRPRLQSLLELGVRTSSVGQVRCLCVTFMTCLLWHKPCVTVCMPCWS